MGPGNLEIQELSSLPLEELAVELTQPLFCMVLEYRRKPLVAKDKNEAAIPHLVGFHLMDTHQGAWPDAWHRAVPPTVGGGSLVWVCKL